MSATSRTPEERDQKLRDVWEKTVGHPDDCVCTACLELWALTDEWLLVDPAEQMESD